MIAGGPAPARLGALGGAKPLGGVLVAVVAALALASAGAGAVPIPPDDVLRAVVGLGEVDPTYSAVLWTIRLPRIGLCALVGGALAVSGGLLQGLFRNPLADPGLLGVASGAALAAAATVVLAPAALQAVGLPIAAFGGSLAATAAVLAIGRAGRAEAAELLLAGVGVNATCGAGVGLLLFLADDAALRSFTFWTLGSLGGASWPRVAVAAVGAGLPAALALGLARRLDVLSLGDAEARAAGVAVAATRRWVVLACAAAVGTSVALCGTVGFVGLVAPHLVRLVAGPSHRLVLPGAMGVGAALLLAADLAARTAADPLEIPVGVVTATLGGPFLLWLTARRRAT